MVIDVGLFERFTLTVPSTEHDRLRAALGEIERAAGRNVERSEEIRRRARWFLDQLDDNASINALVSAEKPPRIVELISLNMATLEDAGSELRASLALALRKEGITIEAIATLFGVTRQRISALLRQRAAAANDRADD
jgi:transcriptional regulator